MAQIRAVHIITADVDTHVCMCQCCTDFLTVPKPNPFGFMTQVKYKYTPKSNKKILIANKNKAIYNTTRLGHSLMVELRTLTPSVLVRIQLPQPHFASAMLRVAGHTSKADITISPKRGFCYIRRSSVHRSTLCEVGLDSIDILSYSSCMFYVYIIQSQSFPQHRYIGYTTDLRKRLNDHNRGYSVHTSKYRPWTLITYIGFSNKQAAIDFEKYLKTGSGQAFANKRLL